MEAEKKNMVSYLRERGSRIWIKRGIEHLSTEEYEDALDAFSRAHDLDPESIEALRYYSQELYLHGKSEDAERIIRRALEEKPDVLLYRTLCAIMLDDPARRDNAMDVVETVRTVCGDEKAARILEAHCEVEMNNGDRALQLFLDVLGKDPANLEAKEGVARALNLIGIDLSESGKDREAMFVFKRAAVFDPLWSAPLVNLGNCYCNIGDTRRAHMVYERGLELEPENPQAHFNLGRLLSDEEEYDAAEFEFFIILEMDPDYPDANFELGRIYNFRGDYERAIKHYETELKRTPESIPCLCNLAISCISANKPEEGEKLLNRAIEIEEDPFALYTLAGLYATTERDTDSISLLERAADSKPTWLVDYLRTDEKFDRLRTNPRFEAVIHALAGGA